MKKYLLDTNIISLILQQHPNVRTHLDSKNVHQLFISVITYGELQYGLAKKPEANQLKLLINEILKRVTVLNYTEKTAMTYANLRKRIEQSGKMLSAFDMLIAAHAESEDCILVSHDQAFFHIPELKVEDWTKFI